MNDTSDDNRYAPPRAELADPAAAQDANGHVHGGRWRRFFAAMIDGTFNGAISLSFLFSSIGMDGYAQMIQSASSEGGSMLQMYATMFRASAPGYALLLVVQGLLLYYFGQSLGKKLLGLRVVRMDGTRVAFARLFLLRGGTANLVGLIPGVGGVLALVDVCMIFRDSRQALHDQIADTVVVTAASSAAATLSGARAARLAA